MNFLYANAKTIDPKAPIPAPSVGVARPNKILPKAKNTNAAGGTKPIKNSIHTLPILVGLSLAGSTGPNFGFRKHLSVVYPAYKHANIIPGIIAAANKSVTGISKTGPMTTNMILGGIRIPSVPPAQINPADNLVS